MSNPALNLPPVYGCCSGYGHPSEGHDVNPPCATVQRDQIIRAALAEAWQAGRETVGLDMGKPLNESGMRPATPNPYKEAS